MPRTKLRNEKNYWAYNCDPIDLDDFDDFAPISGISRKVDKVTSFDVTLDHAFNEDLTITFGVAKNQYSANDNVGLVNFEEDLVNKGRRRNRFDAFMEQVREHFGDLNE